MNLYPLMLFAAALAFDTNEWAHAVDLPPSADAGGPYQVTLGQAVALNGSGFDPEGGLLTYQWDLDSDGIFNDLFGATPTLTFASAQAQGMGTLGLHHIFLRVIDPGGLSAVGQATLTYVQTVPAPDSLALFGLGLLGLGLARTSRMRGTFDQPRNGLRGRRNRL